MRLSFILECFSPVSILNVHNKSHTCEGGAHLTISFCHPLMNFEKPEKSDFWKNEKNCWRYHHFIHVYEKPQLYEAQFLRYRMKHNFFSFLSFFRPVTPLPLTTQKTKILKKWKKHPPDVIILNLCNKKHDHMYAYSNMECDRHNCHSRSFFALLPHYRLQKLKLKFGKNIRKLDILSFNTCVP